MKPVLVCLILQAGLAALVAADCGRTPIPPDISSRIVGGKKAIKYSWPWHANFCHWWRDIGGSFGCRPHCGATLISNKWALTSGTCVLPDCHGFGCRKKRSSHPDKAWHFKVRLGLYYIPEHEHGEVEAVVKRIHLHPDFQDATHGHGPLNDIALLELRDPVTFSDHIQPVCLPRTDDNFIQEGKSGYITGWGYTGPLSGPTWALHQGKLPVLGQQQCAAKYGGDVIHQDMMFCAGKKHNGACFMDFGGPMVAQGSGDKWFQYGIISFGPTENSCAAKNRPTVFTRITKYCDFISATTGMNLCSD